ncbi:MAG: hypothetical protein KDA45_17010 [Planctomycetales bacterium]|nr:hypothetical protein [Planctomycetales bacterium]
MNSTSTPGHFTVQSLGRREVPRYDYPAVVRVAEYLADRVPAESDYFPVTGLNICSKGMAYYAQDPPTSHRLIVALGCDEAPMYLVAEVKHTRQGFFERRLQWVVGCKFIGKLSGHDDAEPA